MAREATATAKPQLPSAGTFKNKTEPLGRRTLAEPRLFQSGSSAGV